ncbi:winged helix-turn-helix domain-containing protein [bacterium]|nr:winged helix-turn-helix domain-containing protein [bacterium]
MVELAGEVAGRIWEYLNKNGDVTILNLKSHLKISNTLICMGIGWLAREDKLVIQKKEKGYLILLK